MLTGSICCCNSLIANEVVQILRASLAREMARRSGASSQERGFVGNGRSARPRTTAAGSRSFCRYCCRENEGGRIVTGET